GVGPHGGALPPPVFPSWFLRGMAEPFHMETNMKRRDRPRAPGEAPSSFTAIGDADGRAMNMNRTITHYVDRTSDRRLRETMIARGAIRPSDPNALDPRDPGDPSVHVDMPTLMIDPLGRRKAAYRINHPDRAESEDP